VVKQKVFAKFFTPQTKHTAKYFQSKNTDSFEFDKKNGESLEKKKKNGEEREEEKWGPSWWIGPNNKSP